MPLHLLLELLAVHRVPSEKALVLSTQTAPALPLSASGRNFLILIHQQMKAQCSTHQKRIRCRFFNSDRLALRDNCLPADFLADATVISHSLPELLRIVPIVESSVYTNCTQWHLQNCVTLYFFTHPGISFFPAYS